MDKFQNNTPASFATNSLYLTRTRSGSNFLKEEQSPILQTVIPGKTESLNQTCTKNTNNIQNNDSGSITSFPANSLYLSRTRSGSNYFDQNSKAQP